MKKVVTSEDARGRKWLQAKLLEEESGDLAASLVTTFFLLQLKVMTSEAAG